MLKFVDGEKPHKLLNYVFSIKITKSATGDRNDYVANPQQIFPKQACDQSILKSVQLFAFPDRAAIESRCFFTFVIGDPSSADFQLGFVLYYTYFDAYCVLSDYYYPDMFNHLLSLEKNEMLAVCSEMGQEKKYNFHDKTNYFVIKNQKYPLDGGRERQQLTKLLFTTFPAYDISKIIIGMLSARHVFVVAGNASTCSLFAAALPLLVEPFFWDLNLIPILPLKIIEMIDVPVPAMIGITRSELLQTQSIAPHICVNCDTKHVLDSPVFEQSNIALRLEVVKKQLDFHSQVNLLLNEWSKSPGFPHKLVLEKVMRFISYYLQLYTGDCMCSVDFLAAIKNKLPDYLLNSQIINQLLILDELDEKKKELFKKWFNTSFIKDAAEELRKSNEIVTRRFESQNPKLTAPQPQQQLQQRPQSQMPQQPLNQVQQLIKQYSQQQSQQQQQYQPQQTNPQQNIQKQPQQQPNQIRATQQLSSGPQSLQRQPFPQRSTSSNFQTQQQPNNNPSQVSSNPSFNTQPVNQNSTFVKPSNQRGYPQKPPSTSASSYSQDSPLGQSPFNMMSANNMNNNKINANTTSSVKSSSSNSSIPSTNSFNQQATSYRPMNEPNPLSMGSSDSFKFNSSDASPNNSLPKSDHFSLANLSNVNNPNGDLLISFSSGGNTPTNNPFPSNTQASSVNATAPIRQTQNPSQNPNFEIFAKYNQQKMQQQTQQNQFRSTQPIPQNQYSQNQYSQNQFKRNSSFQEQPNNNYFPQSQQYPHSNQYPQNRYSQINPTLQNPFQPAQNKPQTNQGNLQNPFQPNQNNSPQQNQPNMQNLPNQQIQRPPSQAYQQNNTQQYKQNQPQQFQLYRQNPQISQNPGLPMWANGTQNNYAAQNSNNQSQNQYQNNS